MSRMSETWSQSLQLIHLQRLWLDILLFKQDHLVQWLSLSDGFHWAVRSSTKQPRYGSVPAHNTQLGYSTYWKSYPCHWKLLNKCSYGSNQVSCFKKYVGSIQACFYETFSFVAANRRTF